MAQWFSTNFQGVRYREHATRKHGVSPDRYFAIRAQVEGKRHEEGLGWASEGWSAKKASIILADLKKAHITGEGPRTLAEKRDIEAERREIETAKAEAEKSGSITVDEFFRNTYAPQAKMDKKPRTCGHEEYLFRLYISPVIGGKALRSVTSFDIERMKKSMGELGKSARTIEYTLAITRQIFNAARRSGIWEGDPPTVAVKKPRVDNGRLRFLTRDEASALLEALRKRSEDTYCAALLSLQCGLRMGEILSLKWSDIDFERGLLTLLDAKAGTRTAFLTADTTDMLKGRGPGKPSELVFPGKTGGLVERVSKSFARTVKDLGLNEGIEDRRQRIVFHSLRHSYASWLVEEGVDLYSVQRLLGHKTGVMTQRYAHHSPEGLRASVAKLEKSFDRPSPSALALAGGEES